MRRLTVTGLLIALVEGKETAVQYGVDVSFPMQHSVCRDGPLGDKQSAYEKYIKDCVDHYGEDGELCLQYERERIQLTLEQPRSMQNYTVAGFTKIRCPDTVYRAVREFWEANKHLATLGEDEPTGYTYVNTWDAPTEFVNLYDPQHVGGGELLETITDGTKIVLQEWTGQELKSVSTYGIRIYRNGHVLATHADRIPLIASAIINVDQDVDEPWPLEVYGHDGKAVNVTMEPGDMVLYESHSVLHGRPFALKGRMFANVFVHFEPTGKALHEESVLQQLYSAAARRKAARDDETNTDMPLYLIPGSSEADKWLRKHLEDQGNEDNVVGSVGSVGSYTKETESKTAESEATHISAQFGDLPTLSSLVERDPTLVEARDPNGWLAIHEAARFGHLGCVKYLLESGADMNALSGPGGGTPLYWAMDNHPSDHPVVLYLRGVGALNRGPPSS